MNSSRGPDILTNSYEQWRYAVSGFVAVTSGVIFLLTSVLFASSSDWWLSLISALAGICFLAMPILHYFRSTIFVIDRKNMTFARKRGIGSAVFPSELGHIQAIRMEPYTPASVAVRGFLNFANYFPLRNSTKAFALILEMERGEELMYLLRDEAICKADLEKVADFLRFDVDETGLRADP